IINRRCKSVADISKDRCIERNLAIVIVDLLNADVDHHSRIVGHQWQARINLRFANILSQIARLTINSALADTKTSLLEFDFWPGSLGKQIHYIDIGQLMIRQGNM